VHDRFLTFRTLTSASTASYGSTFRSEISGRLFLQIGDLMRLRSLPFLPLCLCAACAAICPVTSRAQEQPVKAQDVSNSIGVNTHITYGKPYAYLSNFKALIAKLQQAHIVHIRDSEWGNGADTQPWVTSMFRQLADAGIRTDLVVVSNNWNQTETQLQSDLKLYPGIEAIEAPNECDLNCNSKGGVVDWPQRVTAKLQIMKPAAEALNLPVIGPSLTQPSSFARLGNIAGYLTYGNVHNYNGNRNPETSGWGGGVDAQGKGYGSIAWNINRARQYAPNLPVIATEIGYQTGNKKGTIPETVEGTYIPRLFLASFKRGMVRTYYYELIDQPNGWSSYGLLHLDLSPKPAFVALQNLQSILHDTTAMFTLKPLNYNLTGNTSNLESLLVQKSGGEYLLFVWLNETNWDVEKNVAVPVDGRNLKLELSGGMRVMDALQFKPDGTVTKSSPQTSSYTLQASSNMLALRIATSK
jgi:hypothetical protein